jgi:hypothetical protein
LKGVRERLDEKEFYIQETQIKTMKITEASAPDSDSPLLILFKLFYP